MSENYREGTPDAARKLAQRGSPGIMFAVWLILIGGVLLLNTMGLLPINLSELLRYWPVLLILAGLDTLIGQRSAVGTVIMAVITVAVVCGVLWLASRAPSAAPGIALGPGEPASGVIEEPLRGAKSLKVKIDLSIMELKLGAQPDETFAVSGTWATDERLKPESIYTLDGDVATLTIRQPDAVLPFSSGNLKHAMSLRLPHGIPIELDVTGDLGAMTLDLAGLDVRSLAVKASSGTLTVTLPEDGQMNKVLITADLGAVTVTTPQTATLNIDSLRVEAGSGALTLTLPRAGTIGDLHVKADLGSVTVSLPDDSPLQMGTVAVEGGSGSVTVALPSQGVVGDVTLTANLGSLTMTVPGAKNTLKADSLKIKGGSGSVTVTLPARGTYQADIDSDLGSITVILPSGLEAHLDIDASLSKPNIASQRFAAVGKNAWETLNYKDGDNRTLVTITVGSGGVTISDD